MDHGRIAATVKLPSRKPPRQVVLTLRHPASTPILVLCQRNFKACGLLSLPLSPTLLRQKHYGGQEGGEGIPASGLSRNLVASALAVQVNGEPWPDFEAANGQVTLHGQSG